MKKGILFFFIFCSISTIAQVKFKGIITEQNSGKKPITSANVKADFANPIQSDSKGLFNLTFQGKNLGDEISVNAQKEGYEIVNFKEMMTKIPKKQVAPFKIIMCKAGLVAQNRAKYYGISEKYITTKYKKELAKLNRNIAGWEEKAAKLEEDFRASLEFAKELAERYSLMNLDDVTELQRKAFKLFKENKVEEAIKILEGENYQENIRKVKLEQKKIQENAQLADEEIAKAEEVIQQQISKLMFQADLYAQDFQFDKAERTYEVAVEADTSKFENTFKFAIFLQKQNQHDKAIQYYQRAIRLTKTESDVAKAQNNLGGEFFAKKKYPAALKAYSTALEIREYLAKTNPATYEPDVAMTQNNLGSLYFNIREYSLALKAYSTALKIYERLAKTNLATYEPLVAITRNNLGILYKTTNDYPAALKAYSTALEIYERLAKTNPATYEPLVAMTQNNLGILYKATNDYLAALKAYSIVLEIYERLAKTNPATYEPLVVATQTNLGILYENKNDYPKALKAYLMALEICERLAKANPATYEPLVAKTQINLGILYEATNEYPEASKAYSTALQIYEYFAQTNPDAYDIELCRSIVFLGLLQKEDYESVRQVRINDYLEKAKQILPKYLDIPFAKMLMEAVIDLENYFKAIKLIVEIKTAQEQFASLKSNTDKIKNLKQIIDKYRYLVANGYSKFANELGGSLSSLAWYQLFEKQFKAAEQSAREALNPTTFKKTADYDAKIKWANTNLALALLFQGEYVEAEKIYPAYKEILLADLEELEKAGVMHPDVVKIRELLKK